MRSCPAPMMSGGFPCICNFKKNKQTRRGDVGGNGGRGRGHKSHGKARGGEGLTCSAGSSGTTCLPGRATAGLGHCRGRAQLPAPLLPQSLSVAASARFTRLSLHLPAPAGSRPAGRAGALPP